MVAVIGFSGCCGADIIYNFVASTKRAFREEEEQLNKLIGKVSSYVGTGRGDDGSAYKMVEAKRNRLRLIILNHAQANTIRLAYLKRMGFEFVTRFYNDNHNANGGAGSLCYLFVKAFQDKKPYPVSPNTPPPGWETLDLSPPKEPVVPNPFEKY